MTSSVTFATRPSALARWQTRYVIQQLQARRNDVSYEELVITTQGDRDIETSLPEIGGKGLFTFELEQALREGSVDAAVHSLKDLPTDDVPGLMIGSVLQRIDPRDVLICPKELALQDLPAGATVGTSSNRRRALLLAYRPDLNIRSVRGNIDTRIHRTLAGEYDAIVLAAAGIIRLGLEAIITQYLSSGVMLPAPGQGALAVQCRADDDRTQALLRSIDNAETRLAVSAERAFLAALGGGCSLPVGALAEVQEETITLQGVVAAHDGSQVIRVSATGGDPMMLGSALAQQAIEQGARVIIPQDSVEDAI